MNLTSLRTALLAALVAMGLIVTSPVMATNDAMLELLKVLRDNGTISKEAYELSENSAQADAERTDAKIEETTLKMMKETKTPVTQWALSLVTLKLRPRHMAS